MLQSMEPRRCQVHGIVLTPKGGCVICQRGREEAFSKKKAPATPSTTYFIAFLAILGLAGVAVAGTKYLGEDKKAPLSDVRPNAGGPLANVPGRAPPEAAEEAPPEPLQTTFTLDDDETASGPAEPGGEPLKAAMKRVRITMYSTSWCEVCRVARGWLRDEGYTVTELDVEKSETDAVVHKSLNPAASVPTFDVEGSILVGFDRRRMAETIKGVAEKKLK